jgi:hypothetical protein
MARTGDSLRLSCRLDGWRALVEDYSLHQLTVPTDKLPALSGVASRVHKQMKSRYLAGLWERMLLRDLSWFCFRSTLTNDADNDAISVRPIPDVYIAPSWSWASLQCPVTFTEEYDDKEAEILEATCDVSGLNPYGVVTGGYLVIRGRLKAVRLRCRSPEWAFSYDVTFSGSSTRVTFFPDRVMVATEDESVRRAAKDETIAPLDADVKSLLLGSLEDREDLGSGLVLGYDSGSSTYCRLGLLVGMAVRAFRDAEETIKIL